MTPKGSGYTETTLYEFTGGPDGAGPFAELYMDAKGILYGTATYNGSGSCPARVRHRVRAGSVRVE